jgi:hypothetical protein
MAQSFSAIAEYGESKGKVERGASSTPTHASLEAPIDGTPEEKKTSGSYQGPEQLYTKRVWDSCCLGITLFRFFG